MFELKVVDLQGVYVLLVLYFWQTASGDIDSLESQELFPLRLLCDMTLVMIFSLQENRSVSSPERSMSSSYRVFNSAS